MLILALLLQDVELFNGKDLDGWVNINCAPSTWQVKDGIIVCSGKPTGLLRTVKQYENYELQLEWKHLSQKGNAGLFVHSAPVCAVGQPFTKAIEVQVMLMEKPHPQGLYTGQGDIFSIHGAKMKPDRPHPQGWERCLPSEERTKPAGEWNHYKVVCQDGSVKLHVNGKEVSGATSCVPRQGYICLESEGSEVHFRNIKIRELPTSNPPDAEKSDVDQGFRPIYTGADLAGWTAAPGWTSRDWVLDSDGKGGDLWSVKEYKDFILIADWKSKAAGEAGAIALRGVEKGQVVLGPGARPAGQWNRVVVTMKGGRLTAALNGQAPAELATAALPAVGKIGLQGRGESIQFANLYVKELE